MVRVHFKPRKPFRSLRQLLAIGPARRKKLLKAGDKAFRATRLETFKTEGAAAGRRWAPLSPRYAAWKARVRPNRPILVFDGRLRRSLVGRGSDHVAQAGTRRGLTVLRYGTAVRYAEYHQLGSAKRKLPARPPLAMSERHLLQLQDGLFQAMKQEIARGLRALAALASKA